MLHDELAQNKYLLLVGPPATGKTFAAKKLAEIITGNETNQIKRIQFHEGYRYENFVVGMEPTVNYAAGLQGIAMFNAGAGDEKLTKIAGKELVRPICSKKVRRREIPLPKY